MLSERPAEPLSQLRNVALSPFGPESGPESGAAPRTQSGANIALNFGASRWRDRIDFHFHLSGRVASDLMSLVLPQVESPPARRRRDELWKSTCLEFFLGPAGQQSYLEINLSPSGHWNCYVFDGYRQGMRESADTVVYLNESHLDPRGDQASWHGTLRTEGPKGEFASWLSSGSLVMGVSAVLEYNSGEREYWSLVHVADRPDFHRREGFRLTL